MKHEQDVGYKLVDKHQSVTGMTALVDEHIEAFGNCGRLVVLMDVAMDARAWNYLAVMLSLDVLDGLSGRPPRPAGDTTEDMIDEGAEPPDGLMP